MCNSSELWLGLNELKPFPIESSPQLQHWLDLLLFWLKKARSTFWLFVKSNIKRPFHSLLKRKFEISILEKIWGLWKEAWFGQFSYEKPLQELVGLIFETKSSFHFFCNHTKRFDQRIILLPHDIPRKKCSKTWSLNMILLQLFIQFYVKHKITKHIAGM